MQRTILSLCDYTGNWSEPYRLSGYKVIQIDIKLGQDVRLVKYPGQVHGIIAQPPCTHFAGSGARWWAEKGEKALLEGLALVDACTRFVAVCKPKWWVLENPVGRLKHYLGPAKFTFDPYEYAGFADAPDDEAYTKKTCLWGEFTPPLPIFVGCTPVAVEPVLGSKMHKLPPSPERAALRSVTPQGFARAFFQANP